MKLSTHWGTVDIDPFKVSSFHCKIDPYKKIYDVEIFFDSPSSIIVATLSSFEELIKVIKELHFASFSKTQI